jgi:uncharacterized protein with ParB-like and HNH nuclease domain
METVQRQSDLSIDAKPLSIDKLLADFYAVPDFQREYVWKPENVEQLLSDICDELYDENSSLIPNAEYFIGTIVVYEDTGGIFQLIDGQQRTTTLFIILCVLRECLPHLKAEFDKPNEYETYAARLGNLTLLEMSINTSIQRNFFALKTTEYQKSNFILTRTIGAPFRVGVNTQPNRATADLPSWQKWDSETIKARQDVLVGLAWRVWGISAPLKTK